MSFIHITFAFLLSSINEEDKSKETKMVNLYDSKYVIILKYQMRSPLCHGMCLLNYCQP